MSETRGLPSVEDVEDTYGKHVNIASTDSGVTWFCASCGIIPAEQEPDLHPARAVLALFEAAVPRIKAEALREARDDYSINLTVATGPQIRKWIDARAYRIESEAGKQ